MHIIVPAADVHRRWWRPSYVVVTAHDFLELDPMWPANAAANVAAALRCHGPRDRNWRSEGGEWEPIKISLEIDPLAYIPKITTNPQT